MHILMLLLLCLLSAAAEATPAEAGRCALVPAAEYVAAMGAFQDELAVMASEQDAQLMAVAELRARMARMELQLRLRRLRWLVRHAPERLHLLRGPAGLLAVDWSADDEKRLRQGDPEYAEQVAAWAEVESAERRHPMRDRLQRVLSDTVLHTERYARAAGRLAARLAPVNEALRGCAALRERPLQSLTE